MYVQVLVLSLVFISLIAGMQSVVLTNSKAWRAQRIDRVLDTQIGAARENLRAALAARVQSIGPQGPFALNATTPVAPVCAQNSTIQGAAPSSTSSPCPYQAAMQASVLADTTTANQTGNPQEDVTANNLQTASFVNEQRVSAVVSVRIFGTDGITQLAARSELVTARTFAVAPYAVITGVADLAGTAGLASEGDSAGCDPLNGASCSSQPLDSVPGDTRIHALQCTLQADNSCLAVPGSDAFTNPQWQNPNQTTQQGWRS